MSASPTPSSTADLVVDASVAAKWFFDEPGSKEAHALLRSQRRLNAPSHITVEITNAILRCHREGKFSEERTRAVLESWDQLLTRGVLHLIPTDDLLHPAREIAIHIRHAFADCLYLAAGQRLEVEIITADETMHTRGKFMGLAMTLLKDIERKR